jgi:signal transduction histidine kinase
VPGQSQGGGREALAALFRAAVPPLLAEWRALVTSNPQLPTSDALPRSALDDHVPNWLESFAQVLGAVPGEPVASAAEARDAESHGLQRWQQGYDLHEVTREWGCLHRCMVTSLERIATANPALDAAVLAEARVKLAEQISEATTASAEKYFRLERVEAAGNVHDLERALADLRELEVQRAQLWQEAAHDLRGNLGVVSNVAHGLALHDLPEERLRRFLELLRNNVGALHRMLDDVTALARLQAGQEQRRIASFDAADLLRRLLDDLRPLAEVKGIQLDGRGPVTLTVDGDAVKTRRIAQNLLLNAIKYTERGGVALRWSESAPADTARWNFVIEDSGPGFHSGPGAPIVGTLQAATDGEAPPIAEVPDAREPGPADTDTRPIRQAPGEGLGLAIVKRLCGLLDASVEIETEARKGTIVRVYLPRRYSGAAD